MIVLDASAVVELVLVSRTGRLVATRIDDPSETLHVPHLLAVEVGQVLRRLVAAGQLDEERAVDARQDVIDLDAERYAHEPLLERAWELRGNLTTYDAVYAALAEHLGATLLTLDERLANAPGVGAEVELVRLHG